LLNPAAVAAEAVDPARIASGQCANDHHYGDSRDVSRVRSLHIRRVLRVTVHGSPFRSECSCQQGRLLADPGNYAVVSVTER
jgi:hypothetical protein